MKVLILGGGTVGQGIAYALKNEFNVTIADSNENTLNFIKERMNISTLKFDINKDDLASLMKKYDLVSGALPGKYGMKVIREAAKAGVDLVDNSFMEDDFYILEDDVKKAGITVIPDCGVAPGLSNIIVGKVFAEYGQLQDVDIKVGGLPETNIPPLGYKMVFSPVDTLDEYTRKVLILKDGKITEVEPGEGLEYFFVPNIGSLEAFYTNGLRSLLRNVKAQNMGEKTVRYRGHFEKIRLLKELGLLDDEYITVSNTKITPKEVLAELFRKRLSFSDVGDLLYMEINITIPENRGKEIYRVADKMDRATGLTAMARTTGFTNASVSRLMLRGKIEEKGIIAPEIVGMNENNFREIENFLKMMNINMEHKFQ